MIDRTLSSTSQNGVHWDTLSVAFFFVRKNQKVSSNSHRGVAQHLLPSPVDAPREELLSSLMLKGRAVG